MTVKRTPHAVYDTGAPKYRGWVLCGGIQEREVKKHLWGGEFWEDGRFTKNAGDKATAEVIRKFSTMSSYRLLLKILFLAPRSPQFRYHDAACASFFLIGANTFSLQQVKA